VIPDCLVKDCKIVVTQVDQRATKRLAKIRGPLSVSGVTIIVLTRQCRHRLAPPPRQPPAAPVATGPAVRSGTAGRDRPAPPQRRPPAAPVAARPAAPVHAALMPPPVGPRRASRRQFRRRLRQELLTAPLTGGCRPARCLCLSEMSEARQAASGLAVASLYHPPSQPLLLRKKYLWFPLSLFLTIPAD
jgi:hypothetical protein